MAGFIDELTAASVNRTKGNEAAAVSNGSGFANGDTSWLGGFAASAASSFGELLFQKPTVEAEAFREENPIAGFVSGFVGPGLGMAGSMKAMRATGALDTVMARTGLTMAETPVKYGATKFIAEMAPYELGRLGLGFVAGDADPGEMFADVALSTLLTGGMGGIGGYLKKSGVADKIMGRVLSSDGESNFAFRPTLERRMLRTEGSVLTGEVDKSEAISALTRELLTEQAPKNTIGDFGFAYVRELEGATPAEVKGINSLFRQGGEEGQGLLKQGLLETPAGDLKNINFGQLQEIAQKAGFQTSDDLLDYTITPRLLTVQTPRAAGALAKMLDSTAALAHVEDGMLMANAEGGLKLVAKRVQSGVAEAGAKGVGTQKIASGDQWLMFLTDNPAPFAKKAHAVAKSNVEAWSMMRQAWKPTGKLDPINTAVDRTMRVLTVEDFQALKGMNRRNQVSYLADRVGEKVAGVTGLSGSADMRRMAEGLLDTIQPTRFKESRDSLYQRLWTLAKAGVDEAGAIAGEAVSGTPRLLSSAWRTARGGGVEFDQGFLGTHRPVRTIVDDIEREFGPEGIRLTRAISDSQAPLEKMADLVADGTLSPKLQGYVGELQAINRDWIQKVILPAVDGDPLLGAKSKLLEGYIAPRKWEGMWQVKITDEAGKEKHIVTGDNAASARERAELIVKKEGEKGRKLLTTKAEITGAETGDTAEYIQNLMNKTMGGDADFQASVIAAQREYLAGRARPAISKPASLKNARTGRQITNVDEDSGKRMIDDIASHMKRIGEYAAVANFHGRFGEELAHLKLRSPVMAEDLGRKTLELQGVGGKITQSLNHGLDRVLGGTAGKNSATKIALATNSLMHAWNLGIWNPTYALVNFLQPFQTTLPRLVYLSKAPSSEQARVMMQLPRYNEAGQVVGTLSHMHPLKIIKESFGLMRKPGDELKQFYDQGLRDGTFSAQIMEDWAGGVSKVNRTLKQAYQQDGGFGLIKQVAFTMAEKSEQLSRMHTFNAYYLFGKHNWGLEGDALYQFIKRGTEVSMYGYKVTDRARIFTGPVGSMAGLFKNWQLHFIGDMIDYAGLGIKHNVWGPLLWQNASALAIGGLGGAGALKLMADGLANWESGDNKDSYHWMRQNWGGDVGDTINFGLPSLLGISLQASATMPGTDVRNEVGSLFSSVILERAKLLGQATGAAWAYADVNGRSPVEDPNIRNQLTMALAPRALHRALSVAEGNYYVSMRTGYPMVRDLSIAQRIAMGTGMNLAEVEGYQKEAKRLYEDQTALRAKVSGLGQRFAQAQMAQDVEEMTRVINVAVASGVPYDKVLSSAASRMRREEGDIFTRYGNGPDVQEVRQMMQEGR